MPATTATTQPGEQERPPTVTWDPPDSGNWTLEAAHGNVQSPMVYQALAAATFSEGTRRGLAPFGLPLSHAEMHYVNGWPYVSFFVHDAPRSEGKPPPAWLLKLLIRLHPGFRRRTKTAQAAIDERRAQQIAVSWFDERASWIDRILALQRVDTAMLEDGALADHLEMVTGLAIEAARRHFELIFASIPLGRWLLATGRWRLPGAESRDAVMHDTPVHEEARARLRRIATALGDARPDDLDGIRGHSAEAAAALADYLEFHGGWATADSPTGRTLAEHPHAVVAAIAMQRTAAERCGASEPSVVLAGLRDLVPAAERGNFDRLAADAHETYKMLDDNSGILAAWPSGLLSTVLRAGGDRLVADSRIEDSRHLWGLAIEDVLALLRGTSTLDASTVAAAYAEWRSLGELEPPPHLGAEPSEPPDPSAFAAPVAELMEAFLAFFEDKFNEGATAIGIGKETVEGTALVVDDASQALDRIEPGDILITTATTPSYNTVLGIAAGVVVSSGGPSCHTAVVARELGIPAVCGYADALERIPDGARVQIDPTSATVTVLS